MDREDHGDRVLEVGDATTRGGDLLLEVRDALAVGSIEAILHDFAQAGVDRSSARLREATGGEPDLNVAAHRTALLSWLRSWGCRHLRVADTERSSEALADWWGGHAASLPDTTRELTDMSDHELDRAAEAYAALSAAPAAWRSARTGLVSVSFGETVASKALFAIRPLAFPPWDEPIRAAFDLRGKGGPGFRSYLEQVADSLRGLALRLGLPVAGLPGALGRPDASPPRLVDEYLWIRVTRGS